MTAVGAKPGTASVDGSRIRYADAFPDADIEYVLSGEFVKEAVVLRKAPLTAARSTFVYVLDLQGITAAKRADGAIAFENGAGEAVFRMPRPFMFDSSGDIEGRYSDAIGVTLARLAEGKYRLEYAPDFGWLSAPERVLPITVDPSIETVVYSRPGDPAQNATIYEASPNRNDPGTELGNYRLVVGKRPDDGMRRDALIRFPEQDTVPQDSAVISGQLHLEAESGISGMPMSVHLNEAAWDDSTVTWSTAPRYRTGAHVTRNAVVPGGNAFDLTRAVHWWVRGDVANDGVRILSTGAAGENVFFASSYTTSGASFRPRLEISYVPATRYGDAGLWDYAERDHGGGNTSAVNLSTGNVVLTHEGGGIAARGFGVDLTHTYNAQDAYGRTDFFDSAGAWYGEGWTFSQNVRLSEVGQDAVVLKDETGANRVYARDRDDAATSTRSYYAPLHYAATLTKDIAATPADPKKVYTLAPESSGVKLYFDAAGRLTSRQDRNGNALNYGYDAEGRLTSITDPAGRRTLLEYGEVGGRLSKITDMAGRVSTYGYDGAGNLTAITHAAHTTAPVTTSFGYRDYRHLVTVKNPRGHTSAISYAVRHPWDTAGSAEDWAGVGGSTVAQSAAEPWRGASSLRIDLSGVTESAPGGAGITHPVSVSYNAVQQELQGYLRLPAGARLDARWVVRDSRGDEQAGPAVPVSGGAAGQWSIVRLPHANVDTNHKVKSVRLELTARAGDPAYAGTVYLDHVMLKGVAERLTDNKGYATAELGYDWAAKKTTLSEPDQDGVSRATTYAFGRDGVTTRVTDALGKSHLLDYDADLRVVAETGPDNRTSRLSYYPDSNEVRTVTSPTGEVARTGVDLDTGDARYEIDPRNEELRLSGQPYVATVYVRDAAGNPTSAQTNRYAADSTPPSVDLEADPFPAYQAQLRKTGYAYGTGGVLASMTDPRGNATYYTYNTSGYLTKVDSPAGAGETSRRVQTITPNGDGSPASDVDAKGQKTVYEYDGLGRLTKISYGVQDGTADFSTAYALDGHGNTAAMADQAGSSSWEYDANDAVTAESRTQNGVRKTARYAYYPNGQMSTLTTFAGQVVTYNYDMLGRLASQTDPNAGGRTVAFAYDELSRPTSVTYPSGVSQRASYGPDDNLQQVLLRKADGTALQRFDYEYGTDPETGVPTAQYWNGYVRSVTELDGSEVTYGYDDLGRLTTAIRTGTNPYDHAYAYDPNDNRTATTAGGVTTTATYDAADQLTKQGTTSYTFDRNGNLLSDDQNAYEYDASDKTVRITTDGGTVLGFGYDGEGRRVSRTVGTARTDYWYDQTGMALETGATSSTYLRDPGGKLLSRDRGGYLVNYGFDRLGNVTALVTDAGSVVNTYTYAPYGEQVGTTGSYYNPYRYTSTYQDADTGLYQMGARYYQPGTGRFTQQDPLPESNFEAQRYGYTPGNPVNYTDPTGLSGHRNGYSHYPRGGGGYSRGRSGGYSRRFWVLYTATWSNGSIRYIGITSNPQKRRSQHRRRFAITTRIFGLTHWEARGAEQAYIELCGGPIGRGGRVRYGRIENRINSISRFNPYYYVYVPIGRAILRAHGITRC